MIKTETEYLGKGDAVVIGDVTVTVLEVTDDRIDLGIEPEDTHVQIRDDSGASKKEEVSS